MSLDAILEGAAEASSAGLNSVALVFPPGFARPPGFPRGELLCVNSKGESVRLVKIKRLMAWIEANQ